MSVGTLPIIAAVLGVVTPADVLVVVVLLLVVDVGVVGVVDVAVAVAVAVLVVVVALDDVVVLPSLSATFVKSFTFLMPLLFLDLVDVCDAFVVCICLSSFLPTEL